MALQDFIFISIIICHLVCLQGCHSQLVDVALQVNTPTSNPMVGSFPSLYLTDHLTISVGLQFGSAGDHVRLSVEIPDEFAQVAAENLTITYASNLQDAQEIIQTSRTQLNVSFGEVEVINATLGNTSLENVIDLRRTLYVQNSQNIGYLLNVTLSVDYGPSYEETFTASRILSYAGPEVNTNKLAIAQDQPFIFDREMEASASFQIPPGSWNMSEIQVISDFVSEDISFINLDVLSCLATSDSPNITFSNPASQNVTSFTNASSPVAFVTIQNATSNARRRRVATAGNQASATLIWNLFDIVNTGDSVETVNFTIRLIIGQTAQTVKGVMITYTFTMNLNQEDIPLGNSVLVVSEPDLILDKTLTVLDEAVTEDLDYSLNYLRFTTTLSHSPQSGTPAYGVVFKDQVQGFILEYFTDLEPAYGTDGFTVSSQELVYQVDKLMVGDTLTFSYKAYFSDDTVTNDIGTSLTHVAMATWHSMPTQEITAEHPGRSYSPTVQPETCITPVETQEESIIYDHGLAAVLFFVALIIGCIIVALICLICIKCCRKGPYATVQPIGKNAGGSKGQGLVMNAKGGARSGLSNLKEFCLIAIDDSIVMVLALKDKARKLLEFENLDIWWTITIDIQLEQQRIDAMVESSINLVSKWATEGTVPKKICDKSNRKFQRKVKDLSKTLDDEYKEECRELIKELSARNKLKLAELQRKHKAEYNDTLTQTKGMTEEERREILLLLRQQHDAEKNEVMQLLKLHQDERQEKARKEIAIRKRLGVKSLQEGYLDEVILQSKLDEDAAARLLREHRSNMQDLETAMDDELSRQRMLLEEKLAKRRALAQSNDSLGDHHKQMLNTMVTQTLGVIDELEKDDKLTEAEAERYTQRLRQEFMAAKAGYDKEKSKQEEALHKRLSELKKRKLEERAREHKQQLDQFEKEQRAKLENNNLDPSQYMDAKTDLLASQRSEMHELELSLDDDAAKQLDDLHKKLAGETKEKLTRSKEGFFKDLMSHGMTERMKNEILEQHQRDMERLAEEHEEQRLKQERLLKKRLARHRQEWINRKQEEKQEQQMIRDHEEKVVGRILASQLAISEEDRQRILDEHEKQQVALDSSLALQKLKQRRLLEERVTQRRARQMEKLQRKHTQEAQRMARKQQLADSDEDGEETQQELIKKQAEEKIALLSGNDAEDIEDELEAVRVEMMQAKVVALKEQEEHLGTLVAKLQLERSREIATIEEQQKALWQLKMNMLDNMTEEGIIRNADCKKVIETHQKEAKNLENKLKAQREKQEKDFKRRLRDKLADREQIFLSKQEEELQRLSENEKNKTSARLKRVALKHKHLMEMEEFRRNLEIEVNQALEDLRRNFEVERLRQLQEQELQFISGIVKHGKFSLAELRNILYLLFPGKTEKDLEPLLRKMYNKEEGEELGEEKEEADDVANNGNQRRSSVKQMKMGKPSKAGTSLEEKIKLSILGNTNDSAVSTPSRERRRPNKLLKKLKKNKQNKKLAPITSGAGHDDQDRPSKPAFQGNALPQIGMPRPEPLGGTATPIDDADIDRRARMDTDSEEEERQPLKKKGGGRGVNTGQSEYSY
ncbi:trichohyalin-like [Acanthaster planci]|uniref:Trichohyalin-like n=1 Tax=Acanthaster planci TaxID=133434 RepID=A0A8B7YJU5_ACAPL|nr:trichohyalin-like [Acanthaster planci]XP_022091837.1 trichohyalin-like [Acanthaster planci]XP_022091839.1 trichohyalin-like [Acanthaster planci]